MKVGRNSVFFRKALVVFQFGVSVLLIICITVVIGQMKYLHSNDLGFSKDQSFSQPIFIGLANLVFTLLAMTVIDRFGRNEGFHGQLATCYGLNKGKRWFRTKLQAELDTNLVFSIICWLSYDGLRWERRHSAAAVRS